MRRILPMIGALLLALPAHADFQLNRWSTNVEEDPFEGKGRFSMAYFESLESGIIINCQQASDEITFRIAFPFDSTELGAAYDGAAVRLKVDKFEELTATAEAITLQSGNAGIDADIYGYEAWQLLENLRDGVSKFYIKLGNAETISIPLTGSTRAAKEAIPYCLTENSRKKKSIDWEKEKSVWGDDQEEKSETPKGNPASTASDPTRKKVASPLATTKMDEGHVNAMHHLATARALAHLCPVIEINTGFFELIAGVAGVDLSPSGPDFAIMDADMTNQIAEMKEAMNEAGDDADLIVCAVAQNLYGPTGSNVKNLLKLVDQE